MKDILQGTTPTIYLTIPSDVSVSDIAALSLAIQTGGTVYKRELSDVSLDTENNVVAYTFTQEETLAMNTTHPVFVQCRFRLNDGTVLGTNRKQIKVTSSIDKAVI